MVLSAVVLSGFVHFHCCGIFHGMNTHNFFSSFLLGIGIISGFGPLPTELL